MARLGRRPLVAALVAVVGGFAASCGLNPQPEPPGETTGGGGSGGYGEPADASGGGAGNHSGGAGGAGGAAGAGASFGGGSTTGADAGVDGAEDSAPTDAADAGTDGDGPNDAPGDVDAITGFVEQMNGVWLVGWSGGLNHYSWVRITSTTPGSWTGTAEFLAGDTLAANAPYWPCSGQGSWFIPAKPYSILFTFPASCPGGLEAEYTFDPFSAPPPYPQGTILAATVTPLSGGASLEGYKFPGAQCDVGMTSCIDPL